MCVMQRRKGQREREKREGWKKRMHWGDKNECDTVWMKLKKEREEERNEGIR